MAERKPAAGGDLRLGLLFVLACWLLVAAGVAFVRAVL